LNIRNFIIEYSDIPQKYNERNYFSGFNSM